MSELADFRKSKDHYFGQDHHSPLTPEQQGRFSGLAYYPENSELQFALAIDELRTRKKRPSRWPPAPEIPNPTSIGERYHS